MYECALSIGLRRWERRRQGGGRVIGCGVPARYQTLWAVPVATRLSSPPSTPNVAMQVGEPGSPTAPAAWAWEPIASATAARLTSLIRNAVYGLPTIYLLLIPQVCIHTTGGVGLPGAYLGRYPTKSCPVRFVTAWTRVSACHHKQYYPVSSMKWETYYTYLPLPTVRAHLQVQLQPSTPIVVPT